MEDLPTDVKSLIGMLELGALTALPPGLAVQFALLDVNGKIVQEKTANLPSGEDTLRADAQFAVDALPAGRGGQTSQSADDKSAV